MLNIRIWLATAAAVAGLALTACGGKGDSAGNASVRLANATLTHPSLTLLANATPVVSATAVDTVSSYAGVAAGSPTLQVNDATAGTALATLVPSIGGDGHYVLVAYESGGTLKTAIIAEDNAAPAAGTASLRVFDAATDAGPIDIYVTDPATDITTLSSPSFSFTTPTSLQASGFLSLAPGTYRIRVTGAGNPSDLRLDVASITLTNQQLASVILTPTSGGTLVNAALLTQQGSYTAARNTKARVRLAAAVTAGAVVSASAASAPIATAVVAPSVSAYAIVPAATPLTITVNGATVAAPASAPAAGSDSTLLVYGPAAAPIASLISDDNRLPASATTLKLRLVNGITGAATPLTLNAAFAVIASNVAPGTASPYAVVTASPTLRVDVFSPSSLTPIYSDSALGLPGNAVYTLFMLGDASAPVPLLRKDR